MKLSEITAETVKDYIRADEDDSAVVTAIMEAAKGSLVSETGLTLGELDVIPEMYYAFMCLCAEMYDTRNMHVQADRLNPTAQLIINMHRKNLVV